jgi:hypothetical protein
MTYTTGLTVFNKKPGTTKKCFVMSVIANVRLKEMF